MFFLKENELLSALGTGVKKALNRGDRGFRNILLDSRKMEKDAIFIAIKGDRFDGHDFIGKSLMKGAGAVIADRPPGSDLLKRMKKKGVLFVRVRDSLQALGQLAVYNRKKSQARIIGITGSNGKTTVKDFLSTVLLSHGDAVRSEASFNNHIGVPLTLLKISEETEYAVIEMGMNHKGEIRQLTQQVLPDAAVITNVAESHLEFFKSKRDVASAKAEIFSGIRAGGYALLNRDSAYYSFLRKKAPCRTLCFGSHPGAAYRIRNIEQKKSGFTFFFGRGAKQVRYTINLPGIHNVANAAAAIAVCLEEGLSAEMIRKSLVKVRLPKMRMEISRLRGGIVIINDAYNANPFSTGKAIESLSLMSGKGRKIMVFADMLELGEKADFYHKNIGRKAWKDGVDFLFCTGDMALLAAEQFNGLSCNGRKAFFFNRKNDLAKKLSVFLKKGDTVLLKASRGMKLEEIINRLK